MRDLSGTGQVYRFTLSQLLKSRANRVTLIIMVLLAAVSMPLTALLGGETPETSDTAGLASVRVDNRTDLVLDFSGDAYWADTDFSADAGEPDAVVTVTGDETGYQVAVVGSESAHAHCSGHGQQSGRSSGTACSVLVQSHMSYPPVGG